MTPTAEHGPVTHSPPIDAFGCEDLVRSGKAKVLRQSTLGTADTCHKRLEFDLDPNVPYSTGEARALGTGFHAGLECGYSFRKIWGPEISWLEPDGSLRTDIVEAATAALAAEAATPGFEWDTSHAATESKMLDMLRAYVALDCVWPPDYEVVSVEQTFWLPFPGRDDYVVKGTWDLLLRDPQGWLIIVDHKSAKKTWAKTKSDARHTNQPAWYIRWVREVMGQQEVTFVFDVMVHGLKEFRFDRIPAPRTEAEIAAVMRKASDLMTLICAGGPFLPNTQSFLCSERWCDHWAVCPWGEAMEAGA